MDQDESEADLSEVELSGDDDSAELAGRIRDRTGKNYLQEFHLMVRPYKNKINTKKKKKKKK